MKKKLLVSLCVAAGFCAQAAFGAAVSIGNSSFESPDLTAGGDTWTNTLEGGWTTEGAAADSFVEFISGFAADGNQHVGLQNAQSVYQVLAETFSPGMIYSLTVAAGNRDGFTDAGNASTYRIEDEAGSVLAEGVYNASALAANSFGDAPTITYVSPASGGPTGAIRLNLVNGGTGRSHFDNIRLDASVIPEPVTMSFLSMGALLLLHRRRRR